MIAVAHQSKQKQKKNIYMEKIKNLRNDAKAKSLKWPTVYLSSDTVSEVENLLIMQIIKKKNKITALRTRVEILIRRINCTSVVWNLRIS